jgi:acid phosphatase family membrane protein YuiD
MDASTTAGSTNCILAPLSAWFLAQGIKMMRQFLRERRLDFRVLLSTGGMPSAHTAMVCALLTSVGLTVGYRDPLFAVTLAFAAVVMFDAQSVRRAAGQQARLLNQIIDELFREHHLSESKLAELLGHTRMEVFVGMVTGVFVGLLWSRLRP